MAANSDSAHQFGTVQSAVTVTVHFMTLLFGGVGFAVAFGLIASFIR
jgi:hypothetical protein